MDVHVVSKSVETAPEYQRRVHEAARIHQLPSLLNFLLLHIVNEHSREHLLSQCALASKDYHFVVCNLVCQTHVPWHPLSFIESHPLNLLPDVFGNVITLNCIHYRLLVHSPTKSKDVVVSKG